MQTAALRARTGAAGGPAAGDMVAVVREPKRDAQGRAWIVDFDKCGVRPGEAWKQENLERLRRSLRKEQGRRHPFHWDEARWDDLLKGYAGEA